MPIGEHDTRTIFMPRNEGEYAEYQTKVQEWERDGWEVLPGSRPVGVFQLVRMREPVAAGAELTTEPPRAMGGFGTIGINEDLCTIIDKYGRKRKLNEQPLPEPTPEELAAMEEAKKNGQIQ